MSNKQELLNQYQASGLVRERIEREQKHDRDLDYGGFLIVLNNKLRITGLNTNRENPSHAEILSEQLTTIKNVFDQLYIAGHLLRLSPEQAQLFTQFKSNAEQLSYIITAISPEDLNHRNLSVFANMLKPTMFADYDQILRVSEIGQIQDPRERRQAITQLMSDLGIERASIKKLSIFFETQPTLAQVREQVAKQQWLKRLFWKSASTLGLLLLISGCVATTTETTPPPGTPVSEVTPEPTNTPDVVITPTAAPTIVTPPEQGGLITPDQEAETERIIAQFILKQQARQLIPGIKLLGIDEWVSAPTQPEDSGYYPFAWKRIGDSIALEEIGTHKDNSRHYIFFDYKNNRIALVKADANTYVTVDPNGNWVVLDADNQPAQEIIWQEVSQEQNQNPEKPISEIYVAKDRLYNEISIELLQSFGFESWEKVGEEQAAWLKSILAGTDLNGLQIEIQSAINNGTFYDADGNISVEWKNRGLELMMGVMKDKFKAELDTLTDPEAEGVDYPRLLETVITINGKTIPISLHHGSALYNLYRDKSDWDYTTSVPGLTSTYLNPDFQTGVSTIFEQFFVDRELDIKAGFAESSFVVSDGKIVNVGEVTDVKRVGVENIDKIEFFRLHEQELWVLEYMQRDITPYALNPHYDGDAATPFIDFIWFIRNKTLTFVHVQPGNIDKEGEAWILYAVFRDSLAQAMANLSFALRAESLESRVATNEYLDFYIGLKGQVRKEIDAIKAKETQ